LLSRKLIPKNRNEQAGVFCVPNMELIDKISLVSFFRTGVTVKEDDLSCAIDDRRDHCPTCSA
ncbi:MAG: hypothetical protein JSV61_06800, partial [Anaerolineales bacterium]